MDSGEHNFAACSCSIHCTAAPLRILLFQICPDVQILLSPERIYCSCLLIKETHERCNRLYFVLVACAVAVPGWHFCSNITGRRTCTPAAAAGCRTAGARLCTIPVVNDVVVVPGVCDCMLFWRSWMYACCTEKSNLI